MHTGKSEEQRLPKPPGVYWASVTMKPKRAVSPVPVRTYVEIAPGHVMEKVQSRVKLGVRTLATSPSGSKAELPRSSLSTPSVDQGDLNLCKAGRKVVVIPQCSLDAQRDHVYFPNSQRLGSFR